jgi:hypothetical protein
MGYGPKARWKVAEYPKTAIFATRRAASDVLFLKTALGIPPFFWAQHNFSLQLLAIRPF